MKRFGSSLQFNKAETKKMIRLYTKGGKGLAYIANEFGVSAGSIRRWLALQGVEIRRRGRPVEA